LSRPSIGRLLLGTNLLTQALGIKTALPRLAHQLLRQLTL
jgi:hypothetical protein